jgi:hypothetical protein
MWIKAVLSVSPAFASAVRLSAKTPGSPEAALCAANDKLHQKSSPLSGWRFLVQGDAEK